MPGMPKASRRRAFGAHPRCSDSPPRSVRKAASRPMSYVACGRSLVRNSPRGWAPKALPIPEVRVGRADEATPLRLLARRHRQTVNPSARSRSSARGSAAARKSLTEPNGRTSTTAVTARFGGHARPTALLPADRIVVRDLGAHPRGEFRTSGAAVGQISTRAALAAFPVRNAEDCLSSEGGHQGLPPRDAQVYEATAKPSPRGRRRATFEVRKNPRPESRAPGPR
jgi:hypothetical protein